MESIFHEKQEGQLCAQHALNALLQGPYFTPVDLAHIAQELDEEERKSMAEGGVDSKEYKEFVASGSKNMDDSGFFSVQVIARALRVWQLEIIPYLSKNETSDAARNNPTSQKAYICNYHEHWFTIRKIGSQWFNLNSLLSGPELISDTYLSLFLTQLQHEGYMIFIVNGILPESSADHVLSSMKVSQASKPYVAPVKTEAVQLVEEMTRGSDGFTDEEREQFRRTIEMSKNTQEEEEKRQLDAALAMSLGAPSMSSSSSSSLSPSLHTTTTTATDQNEDVCNYLTEDEMLETALKMSLEAS